MKVYSVSYAWKTTEGIEVSPVCRAFTDPEKAAKKAGELIKDYKKTLQTIGFDEPGETKMAVFDGDKFITEGFCVTGWNTIRYDVINDETGERIETYHPRRYGYTSAAEAKAKEEAETTARKSIRYGVKCHVEEVEYSILVNS